MAALKYSSSAPSLTLPSPRSPPKYPDLSGKRRELLKVQILEREIGYLEEELKSCEGLQLASRSCKEVDDFVVANQDPLIPTKQKIHRSYRFWKWLRGKSCFNLSWVCCFSGCSLHLERINCCSLKNWWCFHWPRCLGCRHCHSCCCFHLRFRCCCCCCLNKTSCLKCCDLQVPSCPDCPSCTCTWSCPKCTNTCHPCSSKCTNCSSNCTKTCCNPCCLFC